MNKTKVFAGNSSELKLFDFQFNELFDQSFGEGFKIQKIIEINLKTKQRHKNGEINLKTKQRRKILEILID